MTATQKERKSVPRPNPQLNVRAYVLVSFKIETFTTSEAFGLSATQLAVVGLGG